MGSESVTNVKLLEDKVLIERVGSAEEYVQSNGIFIPTPKESRKQSNEGWVRGVGKGKVHQRTGVILPMEVRVGDYVLFENGLKENCKIADKEYLIVSEDNIIGILENKAIIERK